MVLPWLVYLLLCEVFAGSDCMPWLSTEQRLWAASACPGCQSQVVDSQDMHSMHGSATCATCSHVLLIHPLSIARPYLTAFFRASAAYPALLPSTATRAPKATARWRDALQTFR